MWLILGIVAGAFTSVTVVALTASLAMATAAVLLSHRHPLFQSLAIAVAVLLVGATLAARQRDAINRSGLSVRQWLQAEKEPDAGTLAGRSRSFFLQQRQRLLTHYHQQGLEGETYQLVAAMTLGDKKAIGQDVRHVYNVSGASHVLALSGLHMGIIYALLTVLTMGRRRRILTQTVLILAIWAFVLLVGMPASAIRAATMLSLYGLLSLGYREKASLNALAFTAIVMLVVSPYILFDVGFQMSYLAVLSILVWTPVMDGWLSSAFRQRHRLVRLLWGLTTVSLAAQLGVAPLIAYYFGRFSTYFLLTNFIAVPAVTIILWMALATLMIAPLAPLLAAVVGGLNTALGFIVRLPGASIEGLHPTLLQILLVYILSLCIYWLLCMVKGIQVSRVSQS